MGEARQWVRGAFLLFPVLGWGCSPMLGGSNPHPSAPLLREVPVHQDAGSPHRALAQELVEVHVAPGTDAPPLALHRVSLQTLVLSRGTHFAQRPSLCFVTQNLNLGPQNLSSRFLV